MPLEPHPTDPDKMVYKAHPAAKVVLDGGPAFPSIYDDHDGLSIRDYFAAKAMQGLLAQSQGTALGSLVDQAADYAYVMADAMLQARGQK